MIALESRPDLDAYRLSPRSAEPGARVARADSSTAVPLPTTDRGRGRADEPGSTPPQTRVTNLEHQIITDVQRASREYEPSREAVRRIERDLLPRAEQVLNDTCRLYEDGKINVVGQLNAQRDYNDIVKQYHDTLVRHRRSMLALNTVLGLRIMP
jgi:cobalt-zinc-cadmium efflux system outer membrane protein